MTRRRAFLASVTAAFLAGCSGGGGGDGGGTTTTTDSDGDGVPDGEDYAPRDPNVQKQSDLQSNGGTDTSAGQTATPTEDDAGQIEKVEEATETSGKETQSENPPPAKKRPEGTPQVLLDKRISLESGERRAIELALEAPATLEYTFRTERLPIDVFLMARSEYEVMRQGKDSTWLQSGTTLDSTAKKVITDVTPIEGDSLLLVFDNSDDGEAGPSKNAYPNDVVDVDVNVTVYK